MTFDLQFDSLRRLSDLFLDGSRIRRWSLVGLGVLLSGWHATTAQAAPSFQREIQPILSRHCFACHGPDDENRQGGLRLDLREAAIDSGAIDPGDPDASELIRRIQSTDPSEQMPPPTAHSQLTDTHKELLAEWVAAGANYEPHWAFLPPQRPDLPSATEAPAAWTIHPIDRFVLTKQQEQKLAPSPRADRHTLVRRVYLDLIGLPPTPEQADAFVNDSSPDAYPRLVESLLASPHFGERWARQWLDLARYSDTNGYEKDRPRSIWPYRDWVIKAINADMPYDQFTIEQLAGDMLPQATLEQRIATGFHRNTMLNEEGGIDPLEFRYHAMVDRVATTGTVWLGMTVGCAQCHTHKYDPVTHTEYFQFMALLNNADEPDLIVPHDSTLTQRANLERRIEELEQQLPDQFPPGPTASDDDKPAQQFHTALQNWIAANRPQAATWQLLTPQTMVTNLPRLELLPDGSIYSSGDITKRDEYRLQFDLTQIEGPITALRLEVLPDDRLPARGPGRSYYEGRRGDFFLSEFTATANGEPALFSSGHSSYGKISIGNGTAAPGNVFDGDGSTGWATAEREGEAHQLLLNFRHPLPTSGLLDVTMLFERHFAASLGRFRISATTRMEGAATAAFPPPIEALLATTHTDWTAADQQLVARHFARNAPELAEARQPIEALRKQLPGSTTSLIMEERPADNPRITHRHHRGEYLTPHEEVTPGVPAILLQGNGEHPEPNPQNRLEFARWIGSRQNPLTARVEVNRLWQALFGQGVVESVADFGTQSDPPSHPELLDWLACEFMDRGWSRKEMLRLIVLSETYQQASPTSAEALEADPHNRWLARGPRQRVEAEMVRDILLTASGELNPQLGGPSVYPPQPASVTALAYGNYKWPTSQGANRYRRSLYTFSKRTAPFGAFATFDAPSGEICIAQRDRSNTPLQALTLLNDGMVLELMQALARDICQTIPDASDHRSRATLLFRRLLTRPPTESELEAICQYVSRQMRRLEQGELKADQLLDGKHADADLAAWTMAARAIANLDEVIVKP